MRIGRDEFSYGRYQDVDESMSLPALTNGRHIMLWTIFVILLILWAVGMVTGATLNGFVHLLLLIAVVVLLLRVIQGRPVA
jgi:hypothetical protein